MVYRYGRSVTVLVLAVSVLILWGCDNKTLEWDPNAPPGGNNPGLGGGGPTNQDPVPITQAQLVGSWTGEYTCYYRRDTVESSVTRTVTMTFADSTYTWSKERKPKNGEGSYVLNPDSLILKSRFPYHWLYEESYYPEAPNFTHLYRLDTLRLKWDGDSPEFRKEALLVRKILTESSTETE